MKKFNFIGLKTLILKYLKPRGREESDRLVALFMVLAAVCGWIFPGLWNLIIVHYGHRGLSKFESRFFSLNQYEVVIFIFMAGFMGWLFSLFFRKRRWEAGILCGVVFLLVSVIWSGIAGYR